LIFTLQSIGLITWEIMCHSLGRDRLQCVKNISLGLAKHNVVCAKIFQALAVGVRALSEEEATYLSQYTDSVPFTSDEQRNVDEIASSISDKCGKTLKIGHVPCNSGIIALAYNGTYDDTHVIVKVKRIGIDDKIIDGVNKMGTLVWVCNYIPWLKYLELETVLTENKDEMIAQCNFNIEVENAKKYKSNNKRIPYVMVPEVFKEVTDIDNDIIVMEKIFGFKAKDIPTESKRAYGNVLAKLAMKNALFDGFYHGDLHAGNLIFSGTKEEPVLGIFDFGVMGNLSDNVMEGFYEFFKPACMDKDYVSASSALTRWLLSDTNAYEALSTQHKEEIQNCLVEITSDIFGAEKPLDASLITRANMILKTHELTLSREFCKLQLALAVGAGVSVELCGSTSEYMESVINAVCTLVGNDVKELI
jgi:predicted unusual protein kinase regulating ubiquinone biosynthesis (AarF/ABC1/UbiB family)